MGFLALKNPACKWDDKPLSSFLAAGVPSGYEKLAEWRSNHGGRFFFNSRSDIGGLGKGAVGEAESLVKGFWRYFSNDFLRAGFPPDWHRNIANDKRVSADLHWSRIRDFEAGDIKFIWELSRFASSYVLARAYAATRDERYPAAFWSLIEDWAASNAPMRGPNWRCGQEVAFRIMAWCFGLSAFAGSVHTTPLRSAKLIHMLAWHATRIEANLSYALSQNNNHSISEAVGLWTVGLLFPELAAAKHWVRKGKEILESEASRQIYGDGAYVQHSINYHRLMLHDYLWAARLGELNGERLSDALYHRIEDATQFLFEMTDERTGQAPNYGANDGALVLPLSDCDFTDFRPTLQAAFFLCNRERLFPQGPWDEMLVWMFGAESACAPRREQTRRAVTASDGGCYTFKGPNSWGMVRCSHFKHRPAHADQLHLDVWWRNCNVVCDAGTYLYNAAGQWNNGLAAARVHNTVTIDDRDQMARIGRFLWLGWAQGKARSLSAAGLDFFEGTHDGYSRIGAHHRRTVLRAGDVWAVVDDITGTGCHSCRLQWLLADAPYQFEPEKGKLKIEYEIGAWNVQAWCTSKRDMNIARAGLAEDVTRGWRSQHYAEKEPAISLAVTAAGALPIRFVTVLCPAGISRSIYRNNTLTVEGPGLDLNAALSEPSSATAMCHAKLSVNGSESVIRGAACACF